MRWFFSILLVLLCVNVYAKTYSCELTNFVSITPDSRLSSKVAHEFFDYKYRMHAIVDNYIQDKDPIKFIVNGDTANIVAQTSKANLKRIGDKNQFIEKNAAGHVVLWTFFLAPAGSPVKGSILIQHQAYSAKTFTHVYECFPVTSSQK